MPLQDKPLEQLRPLQQGCPLAPQVWQVSLAPLDAAQVVPALVHRLPLQQGCPVLPQATQELPPHTTLPAVQRLFEQHASPRPPHRVPPPSARPDTHAPAEQVRLAAVPEVAQA
jgi:hypothetical protein